MDAVYLIMQGRTNSEIIERLGCNEKYPIILSKHLRGLPEEELDALLEEARAYHDAKKKEQPEPAAAPGFRTPYTAARNHYVRSGY